MKTTILIKSSLALLLLIVVGCSKSEENVPLQGSIESLQITSTSSDAVLVINESISFTVVGDDGQDYTDRAVFTIGQSEIAGSDYTFTEAGTFNVSATYLGASSNILNFDVIDVAQASVLIDTDVIFKNQPASFTLVDENGDDITNEATFYVAEQALSGNTFSSGMVGDFQVYATYEAAGEMFETDSKDFRVFTPKRYKVLEDYTGTWCGNCTRVAAAFEEATKLNENLTLVAIHKTANSNPDPMHFDDIPILESEFDIIGLPQARIDRNIVWATPYTLAEALTGAGEETDTSLSINSAVSSGILSVEVNVLFENGSNAGDKLVVYLLEDGIIYDQTNYENSNPESPYFDLGDPIPDFEHNHVLRESLTAVLGDEIEATGSYGKYTKTFSTNLLSEYDSENLTLAVMLVSADNNARNSQHASINTTKDFQ